MPSKLMSLYNLELPSLTPTPIIEKMHATGYPSLTRLLVLLLQQFVDLIKLLTKLLILRLAALPSILHLYPKLSTRGASCSAGSESRKQIRTSHTRKRSTYRSDF